MRIARFAVPAVALSFGLVACGGSGAPPAGQSQAAAACKDSGTEGATLAAQAAKLNAKYSTLATDEAALVASEAGNAAALSDGSDDGSGIAAETGLGSTGSLKVISDCTSLGFSVTP